MLEFGVVVDEVALASMFADLCIFGAVAMGKEFIDAVVALDLVSFDLDYLVAL